MILALVLVALVALVAVGSHSYTLWRIVDRQEKALQAANDRLYGAWKDNYTIPVEPPRLDKKTEGDVALPFIPELQAIINDWEDERGRDSQRKVIRQMIDSGLTQMEVARKLAPEMFEAA